MIPFRTNNRGSALLIAICIMGMLSLIAITAVRTSNTDVDLSFNQAHAENAFYIADAGAKRAVAEIMADNTWATGFTDEPLGSGVYSVQVIDVSTDSALADTVVVRSIGTVDDAEAEVEISIVPEYIYPFRFAMFADDWINFDKATCTDSYDSDSGTYAVTRLDDEGDIGSNGCLTGSKEVTIGGSVSSATAGCINFGPSFSFTDTTSTADSVNIPDIPASEFTWAANNSNASTGISGMNYTYNNGLKTLTSGANANIILQSGVYYFKDITLGQGSSLTLAPGAKVTIYTDSPGDIHLMQSSTINDGGDPSALVIKSNGSSLQFDQDNTFYGAFYGPNAHVQYDQTTEVYGSLVAGTIQLDQGACFHYDRNLSDVQFPNGDNMLVAAWREL